MVALMTGNHSLCKELLQTQTDQQLRVTTGDVQDTLLHSAVRRRDLDIVRLILDAGIDIDTQNVSNAYTNRSATTSDDG